MKGKHVVNYKLLTPGPLTTTETVKQEMMTDHCTWDDDYKQITQQIRKGLLRLAHVGEEDYTAVLMQGSGTFGVESVLSSIVRPQDKVLFATNGAYGERMVQIAQYHGLSFVQYAEDYRNVPSADYITQCLQKDADITHVAMVHGETTTGILNDIEAVGEVCQRMGKTFIVDAMSTFGGVDIPMKDWNIDFLISSANKCIQGVPGFSLILANREKLAQSKGTARSLALDLYDQWETMEKDGKWRFTSPTHTVLAFAQAMEELEEEGGIAARNRRYKENNHLLIANMLDMGFQPYIEREKQSPIITTFSFPQHLDFNDMYQYIKERGYAIYPGKLADMESFRIGNIGEIYPEDIETLCGIIKEYLEVGKNA